MATFTQMRDEMKTCPYNPLHRVSARRLQQHIVKCSKNPANPQLMDCPFNALHKIPAKELQQHILMCKDSRQVIREIEESRNRTPVSNTVQRNDRPVSSVDDWDEESEGIKSYVIPGLIDDNDDNDSDNDNQEFKIKTNIEIQCMKPAERKKYYKEMVERAKEAKEKQLETNDNKRPMASSSGDLDNGILEVKSEEKDTELRKPNSKPFPRMSGIGRGITARPVSREVGSSVGSINSLNSNHVKRERDQFDDNASNTFNKRMSPSI